MIDETGEQGELKWTPPTTDEGWQQLVRYMIDRMIVTSEDPKSPLINVRFEGVLTVPSFDEASAFAIGNSSLR